MNPGEDHIIPDREHIVEVGAYQMAALRKWLERPNGSFSTRRVTFEAVESGGILVRTQQFRTRHVGSVT